MKAWQQTHCLPEHFGRKGRTCPTAAIQQSLLADLAAARGHHSASVALDLAKAYERVPFHALEQAVLESELDPAIWRVSQRVYSQPRTLLWQGK
eukprot:2260189-Amphidinium_carterae.1